VKFSSVPSRTLSEVGSDTERCSRRPQGNVATSPTTSLIYVRVSTKEQTENLSPPTQLMACEEYCDRQSFTCSRDSVRKARTEDQVRRMRERMATAGRLTVERLFQSK